MIKNVLRFKGIKSTSNEINVQEIGRVVGGINFEVHQKDQILISKTLLKNDYPVFKMGRIPNLVKTRRQ